MSSKNIGSADIKTQSVDIPGADGQLDLTEYFGEIKYKNRQIKFNFSIIGKDNESLEKYSKIRNLLHGQKMQIRLSNDANCYYIGRISVGAWENKKRVATIAIDCDCEPYKYKINKTIVTEVINGTKIVPLLNSRKTVIPYITVDKSAIITFNNIDYELDAGTYQVDDIILCEGPHLLKITGNNVTCKIEYQEGDL